MWFGAGDLRCDRPNPAIPNFADFQFFADHLHDFAGGHPSSLQQLLFSRPRLVFTLLSQFDGSLSLFNSPSGVFRVSLRSVFLVLSVRLSRAPLLLAKIGLRLLLFFKSVCGSVFLKLSIVRRILGPALGVHARLSNSGDER